MPDENHQANISIVEDEYYIEIAHDMSREHYISFIMGISDNGAQLVKLYPEGRAEARIKINRTKYIYYYCNKDGLFLIHITKNLPAKLL